MRILLAVLFADFLALPVASADRSVGPETGQARHAAENDRDFGQCPDEDWGSRFVPHSRPSEIGLCWERFLCRTFRWFPGGHNPSVYRG